MPCPRKAAYQFFNEIVASNSTHSARLSVITRAFFSNARQGKESELLKHAPGWKHENASESEASIKADREPQPETLEYLQDETTKHLKNLSGMSMHEPKEDFETKSHDTIVTSHQYEESVLNEADYVKESTDKTKQ
ncbi:hypothetical protein BGX28_003932 [Mortierella sp. GBA30]|nr:hypothetical protein BGX28_003932 [Mortierella sp. GBA30]